jgi:hypothetical protein
MLAQDLQERAMIYSNVVESLKEATDVGEAARTLKARYVELLSRGLALRHRSLL